MPVLRSSLALAFLSAALALAACGGGEEAPPSPGPAPSPSPPPPPPGTVRITFYGHAMFTIETPGGVTILTDPNEGIGYRAPSGPIDVVTVSHDHFDHDKAGLAPGARVLRGLGGDKDWVEVDETIGDVRIRTVPTYHDDQQGAERGKNAVFVFQVGDLTIVHAGDLGHPDIPFESLPDLEAAFRPDVLLLPVGGHFTIGPREADQVIAALRPRIVIPMHYRTDALPRFSGAENLATLEEFLAGKAEVRRPGGSVLEVGPELPAGPVIVVLEPQRK